jgi:hypothetical protein
MSSNIHSDLLETGLSQAAGLLRKYGHYGQADVVDEIIASFQTPNPDYKRLTGIDMWGGSGAVWEVNLASSRKSVEQSADRQAFHRAIIRIAAGMERLKIGTERSRSIAKIFQDWLDNGLV